MLRVLLLAFAAFLAVEPVVHNHPLLTGSDASGASVCVVCVSGVGPLPVAAPAVAAPEILTTIITPAFVEPAIVAAAPRASRAPPTA